MPVTDELPTFHVQKKYPGWCIPSICDITKLRIPVFMSSVQLGQSSHVSQSVSVDVCPTPITHLPQLLIAPLHSPESVIPNVLCDWLFVNATQPTWGQ